MRERVSRITIPLRGEQRCVIWGMRAKFAIHGTRGPAQSHWYYLWLRLLRFYGEFTTCVQLKAKIDQGPRSTFTLRPVRDEWYIHAEWPDGRVEPI